MKYHKLIRDKIPDIIAKDNHTSITHIATNTEYWRQLRRKLKEEVNEFLGTPNLQELADILEVIKAICSFKNISWQKLENFRKKKARQRGIFKKKIILDEVK